MKIKRILASVMLLGFCPLWSMEFAPVGHEGWKSVGGVTKEIDPITPNSFWEAGQIALEWSLKGMHGGSQASGIQSGLAAIYNAIPATEADAKALINDPIALAKANEYNKALAQTPYFLCLPTLKDVYDSGDGNEGAHILSNNLQRTFLQVFLSPIVRKDSEIRLPDSTIDMGFMSEDAAPNIGLLKQNADIDPRKNDSQAKALLILNAYWSQQYAFPGK